MAYGRKSYGRSSESKNDKYLRLTGLWTSKSNKDLFTGRVKAEDVEALVEKFQEALDKEAPIVFSLWDNNDKKRDRKDPDFNLQCFVGDSEEKPRSRRDSRDDEPRRKSSKRDEPEEEEEEEEAPEEEEAEEEEDEKPSKGKKSARSGKAPAPAPKKSKNDW